MRRKLHISNIMVIYSLLPRLYVISSSGVGSIASHGRPRGDGSVASIHHIRKMRKYKRKLNNESNTPTPTENESHTPSPTGAPRGLIENGFMPKLREYIKY